MAYSRKTWVNRTSEYPNRYQMTSANGNIANVAIVPNEGTITAEGDKFDAETMNDMEGRINSGFTSAASELNSVNTTLRGLITSEATRATGEENLIWHDVRENASNLASEITRTQSAEETLTTNLNAEVARAQGVESGLSTDVNSLGTRVTNAEGDVATLSSRITGLETDIGLETDRAEQVETGLQTNINSVSSNLQAEIARAQETEQQLATDLEAEALRAQTAEEEIRSSVTRTYKASGSVYFADLPSLDPSRWGNVYDIKDDFITTSEFLEGAGKEYPAGTNVVIIGIDGDYYDEITPVGTENPSEEGWYVLEIIGTSEEYVLTEDTEVISGTTYYVHTTTEYWYDIAAGFVDLSNYVQKTDKATTSQLGLIKPDGTTVTIDNDGTLHSSSGHIIKDGNGTSLTQRASLKFENCTVTDDSTNNQTVVTPTGQQITVDSSLSATSTNPVQNKILANNVWTLHGVTPIPANADLNDYINNGNYFCGTSSVGATVLHKPFEGSTAFVLKVYETLSDGRFAIPSSSDTWVYKIQEFIAYTGERFYRKIQISDIAGQWAYGTWIKIYDSGVNKVPYSEISGKPTVDSTPTSGSNNLISSDAVYASEQDIYEAMGVLGAKNLLPNIANSGSYASSGTVTKNVNGSLTINGTFDAVTTVNIDYLNGLPDAVFDVTDLIGTDIAVTFLDTAVSGITLQVGYFNSQGARSSLAGDVSTKANIVFPAGAVKSATYLRIASGTYNNVTVYPMMRLASDTDNTYQPYAKTNKQLTKETIGLLDNVDKLGAKNLLPNEATTQTTSSGVTVTVNADKSVTLNGTSTQVIYLPLYTIDSSERNICKAGERYKISGYNPADVSLDWGYVYIKNTSAYSSSAELVSEFDGWEYDSRKYVRLFIRANKTLNNIIVKPMITLASQPNSDYAHYVPYAKTNRELTEIIDDKFLSTFYLRDTSKVSLVNGITSGTVNALSIAGTKSKDNKFVTLSGWIYMIDCVYSSSNAAIVTIEVELPFTIPQSEAISIEMGALIKNGATLNSGYEYKDDAYLSILTGNKLRITKHDFAQKLVNGVTYYQILPTTIAIN